MKITCIADIHGETTSLELLKKINPEMILIAGDITNFGGVMQVSNVINKLSEICQRIYAVPGNCDYPEVLNFLEEKGISLHGKGVETGKIGIFGAGGSNPTPFNTPFEISEKEITDLLKAGYKQISNTKIKILLAHAPPYGILDRTSSGIHAGSRAMREFLENHKIDFMICGHIHEAFGVAKLNDTIIINPGNLSSGCYVIETETKKVERIDFI